MAQKPKPSQARPETQVTSKPKRRRYTAEYKRKILEEADACTEGGQISAMLRREGLYSSHLTTWRNARAQAMLDALAPKKRGPKPKQVDPRDLRIAELERQLAKERARRKHAEGLVELQKKFAMLLELKRENESS